MSKGRWDWKTDAKLALLPFAALAAFVTYTLVKDKLSFTVNHVNIIDGEIWASVKIPYYFQFIVSFFVVVITAAVFEEVCRPPARSYLRTLPLGLGQLWFIRYLRLLLALILVLVPAVIIGAEQASRGINHFIASFDLPSGPVQLNPYPLLATCLLSANFFLLLTHFVLIVAKNRIIASVLIFVFCIIAYGFGLGYPWHIFHGLYSFMIDTWFLPKITVLVVLSIPLEVAIPLWYWHSIRK